MALVDCFVDGVNVTSTIEEGSITKRLSRPTVGSIRFPTELVTITDKSRIKVVLNGTIDAHGTVEGPAALEVDGGPNDIWTTATFIDPSCILDWRRAMDADGDYSNPTFMHDFTTGPAIVNHLITTTISKIGPFGLGIASVASGGTNLSGAPTNWPMMVSQVMVLLSETGEFDWIVDPVDAGGNMGLIRLGNGNLGVNRSGSVHLQYQVGANNCIQARKTVDKSGLANRIRYLLGPRRKTARDPKGLQHWDGSIDRTTVAQLPAYWLANGEPARAQSELDYFIREDTRIFDAQGDSSTLPRQLYLNHWSREAWLRLKPKVLVHLVPEPGILPTFGAGDLISVSAGPRFHGGFSGQQRVMEYTYRFDKNGVVELGAPVGQAGAAAVSVSLDNEGLH